MVKVIINMIIQRQQKNIIIYTKINNILNLKLIIELSEIKHFFTKTQALKILDM